MVLPYQRPDYDRFWAWQAVKHNMELRRQWRLAKAKYHSLWVFEIGRRWGKTVLLILLIIEFCHRRPGSVGLLCTAYQNSIASIILKIIRTVFEPEAPPGHCPKYHTTKSGETQILYIPACDATIKLVGLDLHPDKSRGNFQDFVAVTEAGFVTGLKETYTSVIQPQMKGRPWSWSLFESSTSDVPDHDLHTEFIPDAMIRDAYSRHTIEDTGLTEEEIEFELDSVGGRDTAVAQREYFCRIVVDAVRAVVPEFREDIHVVNESDVEHPQYAYCVTSLDPGTRDKCGVVWFYIDFLLGLITVQAAYAESNQNTEVIAEVVRSTEARLWSSAPAPPPPKRSPRIQDLLKPTTELLGPGGHASPNVEIAGARVLPGNVVWTAPPGSMTWWDDERKSLRANPARRVSDVQAQMQLDLRELHGLAFETAVKGAGSLKAHTNNLRVLVRQGRLRVIRNASTAPLIAQLRSGRWNEKHTDFEPNPALGHLDALMALAYGVRAAPWERNPYRPTHVDPAEPDIFVAEVYKQKVMQPSKGRKRIR